MSRSAESIRHQFAQLLDTELSPQLPVVPLKTRMQTLSLLALSQMPHSELDWGYILPDPFVSQLLLEESANQVPAIGWISRKVTTDDKFGCWALPLTAEYDRKKRA